jgi:hypothetical protein
MPTLGNALDFAKYEARNLRAHVLGTAPATPVTGQLFYNSADNTLYWWDGSAWVSARGGASATPPATTGALGTIQLAGDLAGTATSPQIAAGVITDADVNAANKDGAQGTPSLRTLGYDLTFSQKAMPGNVRIDQLASINGVGGNISMSGNKLLSVADPTNAQDAANKRYVDGVAEGLDVKASVYCATTANISLSGTALVIDNQTPSIVGTRVLVKDQTTASQNGIYTVQSGAWTRATDADTWNELVSAFVFVEQGTANMDSGWVCQADQGGTLGTTNVPWSQFSGAGQITSGAGLTKTGNTLDVGQGAGITVNADTIQVANNGITNAMIADGAINVGTADVTGTLPIANGGTGATTPAAAATALGAALWYWSAGPPGAGTTWSVPKSVHGLAARRALLVQIQDATSGAVELPDIVVDSGGNVTVTWGASVTANSKVITVVG